MDQALMEATVADVLAGREIPRERMKAAIEWLRRDFAGQIGAAASKSKGAGKMKKEPQIDLDAFLGKL